MTRTFTMPRVQQFMVCMIVGLVSITGLLSATTAAEKSIRETSSLRFVPDDVAFFCQMARTHEQVERLVKSKAAAQIAALFAEDGKKVDFKDLDLEKILENFDVDNPLGQIKQWMEQKENKQLVEMLLDSVSNEIFVYAGSDYSEVMRVYAETMGKVYQEMARVAKETGGDLDGKEYLIEWQRILPLKDLERLNLPDTVIGFQLKDPQRATAQLKRLKDMLPMLLAEKPELKDLVKWSKIGRGEFLTIEGNGSHIPWDELDNKELDEPAKKIIEKLKPILTKKTIAVAVGVVDNHLLLSVGDSNKHLETLGEGKLLIDRPEMARVRKHADRKIVSTLYMSDKLAKSNYNLKDYFDHVAIMFGAMLDSPDLEIELNDMVKGHIRRDLKELANDLKRYVPNPGAYVGFSFMTDRGYEGYRQTWTENLYLDGSKKLTITDHVGGNPLLVLAGRGKFRPEDYQLLVKWLKKADVYAKELAVPELDDDQRKDYEKARKIVVPALKRIDAAISKMLLPSLKDGQTAFVLDAKLSKRQWHFFMPAADMALTIVEPAIVRGVSDAPLLKKAFGEFVATINDVAKKLHDEKPENVPEWSFPAPETRKTEVGELFFYPFLAGLGLDDRIAPTAGLSDKIAVLAISPDHAKRILKSTPLKSGPVLKQHAGQPLAAVAKFNWAVLVDTVVPWIEYGMKLQAGDAEVNDDEKTDREKMLGYVRTVSNVLKCFRGSSSATFVENKSLVTHYEWHFKDLAN